MNTTNELNIQNIICQRRSGEDKEYLVQFNGNHEASWVKALDLRSHSNFDRALLECKSDAIQVRSKTMDFDSMDMKF
ncbi:hypothetical protein AKO1_001580 [Acrasis kona]|uniref:Uncharacterized protein n=1 Tax=Acrasis kona TaxID=1008807 RepID=A0AAW2ZB97_9EUKA